jgi:ParB-like chromosome segregation protein Spo0J
MNIQSIAIDSLKPNSRNARTHSTKQIRQIAESMKQFGFVVPIVIDENHIILAGHGRHAAAKLLGLTEVLVIEVHGLSAAKKRGAGACRQQDRRERGLGP